MQTVTGGGFAILAFLLYSAFTAQAQAKFKDISETHWAYTAVEDLRQKGVVEGYPNSTFQSRRSLRQRGIIEEPDRFFHGNRPMTRYEFAAALKRSAPPGWPVVSRAH